MYELFSSLALAFVALFPLVNPVGAIPVFCSLTASSSMKERRKTAIKTAVNVFFILVAFYLIGEFVLEFFGISLGVMKIAGGLIVAHTAWEMVTGKNKLSSEENKEIQEKDDISFTPMALPLLSGPGSIGAAIGFSIQGYQLTYTFGIIAGIFLIALSVFTALILSIPLMKILGKTGIGVLNRIMGFFILAIAVQLIAHGIKMLFPAQ